MVDKSSYKILKRLYKKEREELSVLRALVKYDGPKTYSPQLSALMEDGVVALCPEDESEETYFRITIKGRAYVEQKRNSAASFWVPYAITTAIAIVSLGLTVF